MRRCALVLLSFMAMVLAGYLVYRWNCDRHEAAFQARFRQLSQDAREELKIGTTTQQALQFFARNHLEITRGHLLRSAWGTFT